MREGLDLWLVPARLARFLAIEIAAIQTKPACAGVREERDSHNLRGLFLDPGFGW